MTYARLTERFPLQNPYLKISLLGALLSPPGWSQEFCPLTVSVKYKPLPGSPTKKKGKGMNTRGKHFAKVTKLIHNN